MKTKRELQFLTYLNALEAGDAEGIMAFLALAEADAELEQMMLDHHQAEEPEEKSKVITPFKRKREDVNRWWGRFGTGLVAAIAMVLVGTAGLIIGARSQNNAAALSELLNPSQDPNALTTPHDPAAWSYPCQAEIVRDDNTIQLLAGGDIDRTMRVGVNNPFIILLNSNRETDGNYNALFEGLRVGVAKNTLNLVGECDTVRNLTVYPKDNPSKTCDIEVERLRFPIQSFRMSMESLGFNSYQTSLVLLDAPIDNAYPIIDIHFEGSIPAEYMEMSAGCTSFPLLIQPPVLGELTGGDYPTIEISQLRVSEQFFEHGAMFYLEEMGQIWVACDAGRFTSPWSAWSAWPSNLSMDITIMPRGAAPDGLYEPQAAFIAAWEFITSPENGQPICDLGWATNRIATHDAAYNYQAENGEKINRLTASTGQVYAFYETSTGEHFWETVNPE